MALFGNLINTMRESGPLISNMSRPQGADLDVAGLLGTLPMFQNRGQGSRINASTRDVSRSAEPLAEVSQSDARLPQESPGILDTLGEAGGLFGSMFDQVGTSGMGPNLRRNSGGLFSGNGVLGSTLSSIQRRQL